MSPANEAPASESIAAAGRSRFEYRALRSNGAIEIGELDAATADEVRSVLTVRGLFPVSVTSPGALATAGVRLSAEHMANGLRLLASMLGAGLPLDRALGVLIHVAPTGWSAESLESLRARAREGVRLSDALEATVVELPDFIRGLIAAGDANGSLVESLTRAAEELAAARAARAAPRAAPAYPALLAVSGTVAVGVLVGIVLPRFATLIADLGQALPLSARIVLAASELIRAAVLPGIIVAITSAIAWRRWVDSSQRARERWAGLVLGVPVVGRMRFMSAASRATATLGALLATGIPIGTALSQAGRASGDAAVERRIEDARERVLTGEPLSRALDLTHAVPSSVVQLARAGEAIGDLAGMLSYAARLDRERVRSELRTMVRLVEPGIILVFGGVVALVAASLLQTVYAVRPVA